GRGGALLGGGFSSVLRAAVVAIDEATLQRAIRQLIDAEVLFARGEPPHATYVFKHTLVHEAAYDSLLKRTRQAWHTRVVRVLEEPFAGRAVSEPEVVARHAEVAG